MIKKITMGLLLLFILGCSGGKVPNAIIQHEKSFHVGDIVIHKLDGKRGIIIRQSFSFEDTAPFCDKGYYLGYLWVRFSINQENIRGNDSAGGSGFMGHVKHFSPSAYVTLKCRYQEVELE